ncbi:hypothetical protein GCM10023311_13330 [Flaviramulus aquimarinus]|uniref:Helix-turn-helix domain-containing protein n=1 Tax=Flaviramulus aquimarinus TaxID=1170456 RepID=A0ABP9F163_9FLAO
MKTEKINEIILLLKNIKAQQKEIMSFKEACVYLDISDSLLYKMTSASTIRYSKPNGKLYFKRIDLDEWMLQNPNATVLDKENQVRNYLKGRENGE